jgi:hypothetical protein
LESEFARANSRGGVVAFCGDEGVLKVEGAHGVVDFGSANLKLSFNTIPLIALSVGDLLAIEIIKGSLTQAISRR